MNNEEKLRIIFAAALILSIGSFLIEYLYFHNNFPFSLIAFLIFFFVLILFEIYLRLQHNIDRRFYVIKKILQRHLSDISYNINKNHLIMQKNMDAKISRIKDENKEYFKWINRNMLLIPKNILEKKEDITFIIGIKNRFDYRIENALKSIRRQDYPKNMIKIILVDYASNPEDIKGLKKLCEKYTCEYIRVNDAVHWNRSHCLNVGIRRTKTKYVLVSDVDVIFEKNYASVAITELKENPYQTLYSDALDLMENSIDIHTDVTKDYDKLKSKSIKRADLTKTNFPFGIGINATLTFFYSVINGYDENYIVWGNEDSDIIKRFELIGLDIKNISDKTSFLHQWHPFNEGVMEDEKIYIERNREYYKGSFTIKRNEKGWGLNI